MTCGDFDMRCLKREAQAKGMEDIPNYFKRWINLKMVWPAQFKKDQDLSEALKSGHDYSDINKIYKVKPSVKGMEDMLDLAGLKLEGRHHSGIDDSKNIARCAINLLERGYEFN
jgi:ERI1 exoribonuclease 3